MSDVESEDEARVTPEPQQQRITLPVYELHSVLFDAETRVQTLETENAHLRGQDRVLRLFEAMLTSGGQGVMHGEVVSWGGVAIKGRLNAIRMLVEQQLRDEHEARERAHVRSEKLD